MPGSIPGCGAEAMSSASPEPIAAPGGRFFSRKLRRSLRHASFLLGLVLLAAIVAAAILAPLLASHDPYEQDLANRLVPPFWMDGSEPAHLLGTDQLGRDLLGRPRSLTRASPRL